jgi:mono/diheme cytochrome c family protein
MWRKCLTRLHGPGAALIVALGAAGCRQDMHDQPKIEPLEASPLFPDGRGSRTPVDNTVARGQLKADRVLHEGRAPAAAATAAPTATAAEGAHPPSEEFVDYLPFPATYEVLARGRERYDIYCTPCHARTGEGDGMIVRRGFRRPPSLHDERIRSARLGHLYDVVTHGIGAMPSYAAQIKVEDRWAIVAYLRALQRSQRASIDDVPNEERAHLDKAPSTPAPGGHR